MKAWLKRNYYRLRYIKKSVTIKNGVLLNTRNWFEGLNIIDKNCELATSNIGLGTYISDNSVIKHTSVGKFCSIGKNVQTGLGLHPTKTFVSTHPAFFSTRKHVGFSFANADTFKQHIYTDSGKWLVEIGNDVWIGNNAIILDGVKIGDGAVVAAGAIVTKNVPPYAIVAGIPAKVTRYRFDERQIEKLTLFQWWNWDLNKLKKQADLFSDINIFISFNENYN